MNNEKVSWSDKYDSWSAKKSDGQLVDVLKAEDQRDKDLAARILQERYHPKLLRYVSKKLPYDWVEDVTQEIWAGFYKYVRLEEIKEGVSNLLWTIARNKRADAVERLKIERLIEYDIPPNGIVGKFERGVVERPIEEFIHEWGKMQFLCQVPFIDSLLTDCQRVLWVLRETLGYPSPMVTRLTGKNTQTIYSALYSARKRVANYYSGEDYHLGLALQELNGAEYPVLAQKPTFFVERVANPTPPQLTPDELEPLGLTVKDFQTKYVTSLALSHGYEEGELSEIGHLCVLLTRRFEWETMQEMIKRLSLGQVDVDHLWSRMPEEYMLTADVDGESIILTPQRYIQFFPDSEAELHKMEWAPSSMYLLAHSPRLIIPIGIVFSGRKSYFALDDLVFFEKLLSEMGLERTGGWREWLQAKSSEYSPGRLEGHY